MFRSHTTLTIVFLALLLGACSHRNANDAEELRVHFLRLERTLLDSPEDQLAQNVAAFRDSFPSPLLSLAPEDPLFFEMMQDYRNDSVMRRVDLFVQKHYGDLRWLEQELGEALAHAQKLDSNIRFDHFATFIGSQGYEGRVRADRESKSLVVAIDQYVAPYLECYGYFGDPLYLVHLSDSAYLATDCIASIAQEFIAMPKNLPSLLDYMIAEGKKLYFLEECLPHLADSIRMRYTAPQMQWMKDNEAKVWSYILQNKILFETDLMRFHNLLDDAPHTNCFGNESAPRTIEYIGWQIVRQYVKKSNCTLSDLFENTNSQSILNTANYHP